MICLKYKFHDTCVNKSLSQYNRTSHQKHLMIYCTTHISFLTHLLFWLYSPAIGVKMFFSSSNATILSLHCGTLYMLLILCEILLWPQIPLPFPPQMKPGENKKKDLPFGRLLKRLIQKVVRVELRYTVETDGTWEKYYKNMTENKSISPIMSY